MKTILFISQFVLSLLTGRSAGPDQIISCHYQEVKFTEFCSDIRERTDVTVYYEESWTDNLRVTLQEDSISVRSALERAVAGTDLHISIWHGNLLVLKSKQLITALPVYEKVAIAEVTEESASGLTESEERYLMGRKAGSTEIIKVGKKSFASGPALVKILGNLTVEETGEPIIGAAMFVEELNTGTITDQNGFLSLVIKPGTYNTRLEYLGFEKKKCILEVYSAGDFRVEMKKVVIPIDEVVIMGDRQINVTSRDPGLEKISSKTIREIPTMMGERDILKVSEMMPGIVSVGEGASGLNVRGGSSDQNAFYINKIPIYNTSHLFGFFPAFNSDIVKDFSVYKGYVPAQYGGRLSSVFNIITRQGNRKRFNAHATVNPVTASLTLEGPLGRDKSSILISGRASYSDWILNRIDNPTINASSARFNDIALSYNYDFRKTKLALFAINSYDFFRLSDITQYEYGNSGVSLNLRHNFSTDIQGDFSFTGSGYRFKTVDQQEPAVSYQHGYKLEHYEARFDFNHVTLTRHNLEYGASLLLNRLDRGDVIPYGESQRSEVDLGKEKGIEGSVYLSDMVELMPSLSISAGLRYSLNTPLGPRTVYTYQDGEPLEARYIVDSVVYGNNQPLCWYSLPEIRTTLNFETDPGGSLKLAFNQMHQSIFMLTNTISVAPNTQWKLADYYLKPARSNQISLGVFRNYPNKGWEASLEIFYKHTRHFPEFRDGADFLDSAPMESIILQGIQKSYGIELSVKRNGKKLNGWVAYTFSRALVEVDGGNVWNSINDGKTYPANHDIPHALNTLINYSISRRFSLSSVITYQTGRPITYPLTAYYVNGVPYTDYSDRNKFNIPDYFRVDLSATLEGNLRKNKPFHNSLVFSIYNLTGRDNAYSVYYRNEYRSLNSYKYSVISVPIFTITLLVKLGNYASE